MRTTLIVKALATVLARACKLFTTRVSPWRIPAVRPFASRWYRFDTATLFVAGCCGAILTAMRLLRVLAA